MKLAVVALGGNALVRNANRRSAAEQKKNLEHPVSNIQKILKRGYKVIITHGNGPQVGDMWDAERGKENSKALHECVKQTQIDIGSYIESAFKKKNPKIKIQTIITHVRVNKNDIAFSKPTKGIGKFFEPPIELDLLSKIEESGSAIRYIEGKGYREVVASPDPQYVLEIDRIRDALWEKDAVVACGGGGIPVFKDGSPARAVIDKDLATERLASKIGTDVFVILTKTDGIAQDYDRSLRKQNYLASLNIDDANKLLRTNYFESGTIRPKALAAARFVERTGNTAYIGRIDGDLGAIILGKQGTAIGKAKSVLRSGKPATI